MDKAMRLVGGTGMFRSSPLDQLYRYFDPSQPSQLLSPWDETALFQSVKMGL